MANKRLKTFSVMAKIKLDMDIEIAAADLDDALKRARDLGLSDFVGVHPGQTTDCDLKVYGVFQTNEE